MTAGLFPFKNIVLSAASPSRRSEVSTLNTPLPKHKMKGILCKNHRAETSSGQDLSLSMPVSPKVGHSTTEILGDNIQIILGLDSLVGDPCGKIPDGDPGYKDADFRDGSVPSSRHWLDSACLLVGAAIDNNDSLDDPGRG